MQGNTEAGIALEIIARQNKAEKEPLRRTVIWERKGCWKLAQIDVRRMMTTPRCGTWIRGGFDVEAGEHEAGESAIVCVALTACGCRADNHPHQERRMLQNKSTTPSNY